jgi:glycosyltransferase involved in cell wall biosynthesis
MDLTIVVCTRNRGNQLRTCLDSITRAIERQSRSMEVIIVDNASTDNTRQVAQEWALASRIPARVVVENRPGLAVARNTAVQNAQGNVIAFTDDDCALSDDYVTKLMNHYDQDSEPVVRGGKVEAGNRDDLDFSVKKDSEFSRLSDIARVAGFILGCNMVVPRQAIARVGQFDERFGAGGLFRSAEDTDFICRTYLAGIPIEYVPDMIVFHNHGRRSIEEVKQQYFGYCVGNGALYGKYCRVATRLLRHFYWDSRNAVFELFGGRQFDLSLGLTYRWTVIGNMLGLILFCLNGLGFRGRFASKQNPGQPT